MQNKINKVIYNQILTQQDCKDIKTSIKKKLKSRLAILDRELKTIPEINIILDGVDHRYYKNNTELLLGALINMLQVYKKALKKLE